MNEQIKKYLNIKHFTKVYYFIFLIFSISVLFDPKKEIFSNDIRYVIVILGLGLYMLDLIYIKNIDILKFNYLIFLKYLIAFIFSFFICNLLFGVFLLFFFSYEELVDFDFTSWSIISRRIIMFFSIMLYITIIENSKYFKTLENLFSKSFNISELVYITFSLLIMVCLGVDIGIGLFIFLILLFSIPEFLLLIIYNTVIKCKDELKNNPRLISLLVIIIVMIIIWLLSENKAFASGKETKVPSLGKEGTPTNNTTSPPKGPNPGHVADKKLFKSFAKKLPVLSTRVVFGIWTFQAGEYVADKIKHLPPGTGTPIQPDSPASVGQNNFHN
jgi:hypothetical protein